ncbi:S8 family peptidase [Paenibacillus tarimensis]
MHRVRVSELLRSCIRSKKSRRTERKLIGLKSKADFQACVSHLKRQGMHPIKQFRSSSVLCCHVGKGIRFKKLIRHPGIAFVENDIKLHAHTLKRGRPSKKKAAATMRTSASIPWNIQRVQAPRVWNATKGGAIKLAVIDTGIARHPNLRVAGGVNSMGGKSFRDDNGHGTHVAGIAAARGTGAGIIGVAPDVRLYAVKALDRNGEGYVSDIIEGIEWCIRNGMNVINMSLGLDPNETSRALLDAVRRARRRGIVIVASAGNDGPNSRRISEPAAFNETIAVAASTRNNRIASFSSRGRGIDLAAPGSRIRSTWLRGGYKTLSGTSMASPHVAAGAALLLARRARLGPSAVKKTLKANARKLQGSGTNAQGAGLLQLAPIGRADG